MKTETPKRYLRIDIHSEEDLPEEAGVYFAHMRDTTLNGQDIGNDTFSIEDFKEKKVREYAHKSLVKLYDWYLIEQPEQPESLKDELMKPLEELVKRLRNLAKEYRNGAKNEPGLFC